jgi:hypothetical protein
VRTVDFMVVDVEGAELEVLRSIIWSRVRIGVICVEADGNNEAKDAAVRALLDANGYAWHGTLRGSDWFSLKN